MRSKKALRSIISNLLLQVVIILNGFILPKIIIGHFGSSVNGLVASVTQFLAYITLLESGFGPVVKAALYGPIANKDKGTIEKILKASERFFKIVALVFLAYIVVLCFVYPTIINQDFEWAYTASLIVIIGISTFAEYYFGMTYNLFLQARQKRYVISNVQIVSYVLSIATVLLLVKIGASIHLIKLASGLLFVIRPLVLNRYVKRKYKISLKDRPDDYKLERKWDGFAQHVAYVIHTKTDIVVLTIFTTLTEVSVYSVYMLVVKGITSIIGAFSSGIDAVFGDMIAKREKENLNKKFSVFETIYYSVATVFFASAIVLIVPFINVYMNGVTDVDYTRPLFGVLIVISELVWAIRQPYNSVILAAGHFRETRVGAWVECLSNIVISVALVNVLGIVGVAIGTVVAMTLRTVEFIVHADREILERPIYESIKKIILVVIETILIVLICNYLPFRDNTGFLNWLINASMVLVVSTAIVLTINIVFLRKDYTNAGAVLKNIIHKRKDSNGK